MENLQDKSEKNESESSNNQLAIKVTPVEGIVTATASSKTTAVTAHQQLTDSGKISDNSKPTNTPRRPRIVVRTNKSVKIKSREKSQVGSDNENNQNSDKYRTFKSSKEQSHNKNSKDSSISEDDFVDELFNSLEDQDRTEQNPIYNDSSGHGIPVN